MEGSRSVTLRPRAPNYIQAVLYRVDAFHIDLRHMADTVDKPTSHTDHAGQNSLVGASAKAIIKNVDMSEDLQQESVDIASVALEKYNIEKDIAAYIKKEFDRKHGPTWHVVVGKNFGSYVTHGRFSIPTFCSEQWEPCSLDFCFSITNLVFLFQKPSTSSISTWAHSLFSFGSRRYLVRMLMEDNAFALYFTLKFNLVLAECFDFLTGAKSTNKINYNIE